MSIGCNVKEFSFFDKNINSTKIIMQNVDFSLKDEKEIKLVYGHIGVGKSTLLYILAGLLDGVDGKIYWDDFVLEDNINQIDTLRSKYMSVNFSNFFYIKDMNVEQNIIFPAVFAKKSKAYIKNKLNKLYEGFSSIRLSGSEIFNLKDYKDKKIGTLSNGQREIVMLARTLINESKYILADEMLRSFNTDVKKQMLKILFKDFNLAMNGSLLLITHDDRMQEYMLDYAPKEISIKSYIFQNRSIEERK